MSVRFSVAPGTSAPSGAAALTLSGVRMIMEPVGKVKDFTDQLTGSYTPFQMARICQTWFDLNDAATGLSAGLDQICMKLGNEHDSLLNFVDGPAPTNTGATFGAGGFSLDGLNDEISTGIVPSAGGHKFSLTAACVGVCITDASALANGAYVIGRGGAGGLNTQISPNSNAASTASFRINGTTTITGEYIGDRRGVWALRSAATGALRGFHNEDIIAQVDNYVMSALIANPLSIGRQGSTYAAFDCGGWYVGGSLNIAQIRALSGIINTHVAVFT